MFCPLALCIVCFIFSTHIMEDWARQKLRFTGNGADFVRPKPLLEVMMAAMNETKVPCAAFLKKKGAKPDVTHILGAGSKAVYYKVLWPKVPMDSEDGGTTARHVELDKWLEIFYYYYNVRYNLCEEEAHAAACCPDSLHYPTGCASIFA